MSNKYKHKLIIYIPVITLLLIICIGATFYIHHRNAPLSDKSSLYVYLVRHGKTDANVDSILAGSGTDVSINNNGIQQAKDTGKEFKKVQIGFDAIYTSKMIRTKQTAESILREDKPNKNLKVKELSGLNDISWGQAEGRKNSEIQSQYGSELNDYLTSSPDENIKTSFGAEGKKHFVTRFDSAMNHIADDEWSKVKKRKSRNVLVVAHSSAAFWLKSKFDNAPDGLDNASVTILKWDGHKWNLLAANLNGENIYSYINKAKN